MKMFYACSQLIILSFLFEYHEEFNTGNENHVLSLGIKAIIEHFNF